MVLGSSKRLKSPTRPRTQRRRQPGLGLEERIRSSHHIFTRSDVEEILNLQPRDHGNAKPYQVKQVREVILKYKLGEIRDADSD